FIGINNTLTTRAVMIVSPVERPVASAAYGFVRFIGGGLAPYAAGKLVEHFNLHVPFAIAVITVLGAVAVLVTAHTELTRADKGLDEDGHDALEHNDPSDDAEADPSPGFGPASTVFSQQTVVAGPNPEESAGRVRRGRRRRR